MQPYTISKATDSEYYEEQADKQRSECRVYKQVAQVADIFNVDNEYRKNHMLTADQLTTSTSTVDKRDVGFQSYDVHNEW